MKQPYTERTANREAKALTVAEAAKLLSTSETSVWRLLRAGTLTRLKVGPRLTRIARTEVEALATGARYE